MNRILFQADEVDRGRVRLADGRAEHIRTVLRGRAGQLLRVGIIDGPRGVGRIDTLDAHGVELSCRFDAEVPPRPCVDLLLALPRPKVLKRLWAPVAAMGVGRIVLTNAARVERNYFDTHWLAPECYRPLLLEGLMQSGDTRLPEVRVEKRLKPFLEDSLNGLYSRAVRLIAHPRDAAPIGAAAIDARQRLVLAVGPEGGWTDYELDLFARQGFVRIRLGQRALRTDTACLALMGGIHALRDAAAEGVTRK